MNTLKFKKLDKETYYVYNGKLAFNVYARYSNICKHYSIDVSNYYFEVSTIKEAKEKIINLFLDNKIQSFEI